MPRQNLPQGRLKAQHIQATAFATASTQQKARGNRLKTKSTTIHGQSNRRQKQLPHANPKTPLRPAERISTPVLKTAAQYLRRTRPLTRPLKISRRHQIHRWKHISMKCLRHTYLTRTNNIELPLVLRSSAGSLETVSLKKQKHYRRDQKVPATRAGCNRQYTRLHPTSVDSLRQRHP